MKIKLDIVDKICIFWAWVVVWTVGLIPSAIWTWLAYKFRKNIRNFIIKYKIKESGILVKDFIINIFK